MMRKGKRPKHLQRTWGGGGKGLVGTRTNTQPIRQRAQRGGERWGQWWQEIRGERHVRTVLNRALQTTGSRLLGNHCREVPQRNRCFKSPPWMHPHTNHEKLLTLSGLTQHNLPPQTDQDKTNPALDHSVRS